MADDRTPNDRETPAVDRRALLRSILGGAAAVAGVAAVGTPSLARAARALPPACDGVDFRLKEQEMKSRERHEKQALRGGAAEARAKQDAKQRLASEQAKKADAQHRYATTGPAPAWIDVEGRETLEAEVELSSVKASGDETCTVTMDLRFDTLGRGSVKEAVARLTRLLPPAPGKDAPFLTVTWGADGDQAFEGFLEDVLLAWEAWTPDDVPVRALARATFLIA